MGRSQRHKVIIQYTDSAGKGLSEKQPALRYINQYENSQAFSNFSGPTSGPLKGSTMAGFPPTLIPLPGAAAEMDAELNATGDFSEPGQFNLSGNPIYTDLPASNEPEPPPVGSGPTLTSITPDTTQVGVAVTVTLAGTGFTDTSVVKLDGNAVVSSFVSDTEMTADIPGPLQEGDVQVTVDVDGQVTGALTFTATAVAAGGRAFPLGPFDIQSVTGDGEKLSITVSASSDVIPGDSVTVEATGNTSVNGTYTVESVTDGVVVVPSSVALASPIEAKGRLIVTGAA